MSLLTGIVGVCLIVFDGLSTDQLSWLSVIMCVLGLAGLSFGQFYHQMQNIKANLLVIGFIQCGSSAVVCLIGAWLFEDLMVMWRFELIISLFWMVFVVSIGALIILFLLMRYDSADKVATIFYGVPISAAICAWIILEQVPSLIDWIGFSIILSSIIVYNWDSRRDGPMT